MANTSTSEKAVSLSPFSAAEDRLLAYALAAMGLAQAAFILGLNNLLAFDWLTPLVSVGVLVVFCMLETGRVMLRRQVGEPGAHLYCLWQTIVNIVMFTLTAILALVVLALISMVIFFSALVSQNLGGDGVDQFMDNLVLADGSILGDLLNVDFSLVWYPQTDPFWGPLLQFVGFLPMALASILIGVKLVAVRMLAAGWSKKRIAQLGGLAVAVSMAAVGPLSAFFYFLFGLFLTRMYLKIGRIGYCAGVYYLVHVVDYFLEQA